MGKPVNHFYEFGQFRVDVGERLLFREGTALSLPPKAFDILLALVQQSGHVLEKRELIETVWPDTFIEENNLTQYISALRKALGDDRREQQYIETVARRGYRFIASVSEVHGDDGDLIIENRTRVRVVIKEEKEERAQELVIRTHEAPLSSSVRKLHQRVFARYAVLALFLTGIVISVYWLASRVRQPPANAAVPIIHSVVVLPFKPGAGEPDQYLGLALAHDLSTRLSQDGLHVLPVSASYRYLDEQGDPVRAGRELAVDAVIYGTLNKSGRRIAIEAQLARVSDGVLIWKKSFEDETRNTFALQNSITSAVTQVLLPNAEGIEPAPPPGTLSLDAYEDCEKGRFYLSKRTAEAIHLSLGYFERAITEDQNYALAHVGLAEAYAFDTENWKRAEATALKALEIDKNLGEAHAVIGFVHMFWLWDWRVAEQELKRAIELSPDCATAHQWYAIYLATQAGQSKAEMRKALELDPFSIPINADMGQMFYLSQQYEEAIEQCQKTIAMDPEFLNAHIYLHDAYTQRGMYDKAFAEYFNIQKLAAGNLLYSAAAEESLRKGYQESGIKGFWKARLAFLEKRSHDDVAVAEYCARLGDKERALNLLNQAYRRHTFGLAFLNVNPVFSDLRTEPRFERLSDRIFPKNDRKRS
jgi:DNA-binding winged helix-turn-helix (wHTH) protein/TolB-like protein/tetratricopeptide (TPR) repeat protein